MVINYILVPTSTYTGQMTQLDTDRTSPTPEAKYLQ